ncbi:oxidoreductase [Streptomyces sp. NPDC002574]|uniref:oxidoreductase n=1 Tax=Streptomyces sp. NPDC002574 TaxID=3364652 RepID=UPI0036CAFC1B
MTEPPDIAPPHDWTPVEQGLWRAFRLGELYDLRTGIPERDDPAADRFWGPDRTVRAETIARLLLDGPQAASGRVSCVKLSGAQISGQLNLSGGTVVPYVELHDCRFEEQVLLAECSFTTLRMVRCAIPRLEAARLHTSGDLHLPQCTIEGGVRLTDAHIGTDLLLNQITLRKDRHGRALAADGLSVAQDVEAELMEATGEISLRSARIGGRLSLRGSRLRNPEGRYALNAARVTVEHTLYLSSGGVRPFSSDGGVRLDDGRFGNGVIIHRARFRLAEGQQLSLRRVQTPELRLTLDQPPTGTISLAGARVGNLTDNHTCWPATGGMDLTGFSYGSLSPEGSFPLRARIAWLAAATPEYSPEPYEHLSAALRASGEDADAREVQLAKQRRRRETLPIAGKLWGFLQDITVGYGYRPGRAAIWMALLWAIGAVFFQIHGEPQPVDGGAFPHWNAPLFALDLLLPVINLGQDNAWRLSGDAQWGAAFLTMLGWILATTVAAGASRLLRRG